MNDNDPTLPQQIAFLTNAVSRMADDYVEAGNDKQRRALRLLIKETLKKIERLKRMSGKLESQTSGSLPP